MPTYDCEIPTVESGTGGVINLYMTVSPYLCADSHRENSSSVAPVYGAETRPIGKLSCLVPTVEGLHVIQGCRRLPTYGSPHTDAIRMVLTGCVGNSQFAPIRKPSEFARSHPASQRALQTREFPGSDQGNPWFNPWFRPGKFPGSDRGNPWFRPAN